MAQILVIEDEPEVSKLLKMRLEGLHFEVLTAFDGLQALKVLDAHTPSLILLDLMMPNMDGMEFVGELRSRQNDQSKIPIIVVTAKGTFKKSFEKDEIQGFVEKPFKPEVLIKAIDKVFK